MIPSPRSISGVKIAMEGYDFTNRPSYKPFLYHLDKAYGVESYLFDPRNPKAYSFEDLDNELRASETSLPEEDFAPEEPMNEEEGFAEGEEDIPEETWDEVNLDEMKSESDAINVLEIVATYHNSYMKHMEEFYRKNDGLLENSGDFASIEIQETLEKAMKLLSELYKDSEDIEVLTKLHKVLLDKRRMTSICGKKDSPFLYEGFQLVFLEYMRSLLALFPFCLKQNAKPTEVIASMDLKVVKILRQMAEDIVEVQHLYGNTLFYVEPMVSDITGKSEELANTPYQDQEVFQEAPMESCMKYAGESIMNLIEIKNQNALPEYSILLKACMVVSGLVKGIGMKKSLTSILDAVVALCGTEDTEAVQDAVVDAMEKNRSEVFLPQIAAMTELSKEEQEKIQEKAAEK